MLYPLMMIAIAIAINISITFKSCDFEKKLDAITRMADTSNIAFSEFRSTQEVQNYALALTFSENALPSISDALKERGIDFTFDIPILSQVLERIMQNRHILKRGRVREYLEGLKNISEKSNIVADENIRNKLNRLV